MDSIIIILPTNATEVDLNHAIKLAKEELQERRRQGTNPTEGYVACFTGSDVDSKSSFEKALVDLKDFVDREIRKERDVTDLTPVTWDEFGKIIVRERDKYRSNRKTFLTKRMVRLFAEATPFEENIMSYHGVPLLKPLCSILLS